MDFVAFWSRKPALRAFRGLPEPRWGEQFQMVGTHAIFEPELYGFRGDNMQPQVSAWSARRWQEATVALTLFKLAGDLSFRTQRKVETD